MDESDLRFDQRVRRSMRDLVREALVTGLAVVVPLIITAIVLATALEFVHDYVAVIADASTLAGNEVAVPVLGEVRLGTLLVEVLTPVVLLGVIFVVGLFVSTTHVGERAVDYFDGFISRIPAVGGVYESFRQMSDVVLESDVRNFRDVKLVEFPRDDTYTLGFVTTQTPTQLAEPVGHGQMLTIFLPLAPNPVMGGHLVHVHPDKVVDVDMTVEEGLRTVVTSGVAVSDDDSRAGTSLSEEHLRDLANVERAEKQFEPARDDDHDGGFAEGLVDETEDRADAYADDVDPAAARTPDGVARRGRDEREPSEPPESPEADNAGGVTDPPAEAAGRDADEADTSEHPPAEAAARDPTEREPTREPPDEAATRAAADSEATDERPAEATEEPGNEADGDERDAATSEKDEQEGSE